MVKESVVDICTVEYYYSVIKNNEIMSFARKWMALKNSMLTKMSQT
jgi:hypothetical protein